MANQYWQINELPIGFRFVPEDRELIESYLVNKIFDGPLPADVIKDIDASELYSKHPKRIVENVCGHEKAWYLFTHGNEGYNEIEKKRVQLIGDGIGFWRGIAAEDPIYDSNGNIFASKTHWRYFEGPISNCKVTLWTMEEYRLSDAASTGTKHACQPVMEWVLVKIKYGRGYNSF